MRKLRILIMALCAVATIAASVMGTLSYLTDSEQAVNTFTVGNVDIILDETDVDTDGRPIDGNPRVKGNEYHLIPAGVYVKDPTVTVKKGSEEAYIRMLVTISDISDIKAVLGDWLPENYVEGYNNNIWKCVNIKDNGDDTVTYEFRYYKGIDKASADIVLEPLFEKIKVPVEIDGKGLSKIQEMKITVIGNAIQKAGFENEDAAWKAFDTQMK